MFARELLVAMGRPAGDKLDIPAGLGGETVGVEAKQLAHPLDAPLRPAGGQHRLLGLLDRDLLRAQRATEHVGDDRDLIARGGCLRPGDGVGATAVRCGIPERGDGDRRDVPHVDDRPGGVHHRAADHSAGYLLRPGERVLHEPVRAHHRRRDADGGDRLLGLMVQPAEGDRRLGRGADHRQLDQMAHPGRGGRLRQVALVLGQLRGGRIGDIHGVDARERGLERARSGQVGQHGVDAVRPDPSGGLVAAGHRAYLDTGRAQLPEDLAAGRAGRAADEDPHEYCGGGGIWRPARTASATCSAWGSRYSSP
jgi:hypothetical protein